MSESVIEDDISTLPDETKTSDNYNQSQSTSPLRFPLRGQPQWVEDICLILGRLFSLIALILVILWAHGTDIKEGYLGGINWKDHVFSFHPLMMIASFFFTGWSITSYRIHSLTYIQKKYLHLIAHILAKICLTIGLRAVYESKRKGGEYHYHLLSLHTWLGTITAILLIQNDLFGALTFLFPLLSKPLQLFYRPYHIFFGKMALIFVVITIETGLMEENTFLECSPSTDSIDNTPGSHYLVIPPGCRLSSGLGLVIVLAMLFLFLGLRNQRANRLQDHRESQLGLSLTQRFWSSSVGTGGGGVVRDSELLSESSFVSPLTAGMAANPGGSGTLSKRAISMA
jgi:hypothetical protein